MATTTETGAGSKLGEQELKDFILDFYKRADNSEPLAWFLPYIEEDHHMIWTPTCQFYGQPGFEEFYRNLTSGMFDRKHEIENIKVFEQDGVQTVTFTIHLTGRVWKAPHPKSFHAENWADFMWTVRRSQKTGKVAIMNYFLTAVKFPEGSVIVDADKVFKYESWAPGPFQFPPAQ